MPWQGSRGHGKGNTVVLIRPSHSLIVSDQLCIALSPCNRRYNSTDYTSSDSRDQDHPDCGYVVLVRNENRNDRSNRCNQSRQLS